MYVESPYLLASGALKKGGEKHHLLENKGFSTYSDPKVSTFIGKGILEITSENETIYGDVYMVLNPKTWEELDKLGERDMKKIKLVGGNYINAQVYSL